MAGKGKETSVEERKIILRLHAEGKSLSEIGKIVSKSRYTVRSVINRFKGKKNLDSKPRTGRPRKLNDKEQRCVVKFVKKDPTITSSSIATQLKNQFDKTVTPRTVQNVLREAGYNSRVPRKKPYISKTNQRKRIEFAREHQNKDLDFWRTVIFSDESKFNIFRCDGRISVWRKPNTELERRNMLPTVKHGGGGVLVWGCMAASGVGELVFIEEIMDKMLYLNILKNNLSKSAEKLGLAGNYYFQQDNDPKHTAHIVREWILYNTPHTLKTPPQSPDLNPIEHLWDALDKRIRTHDIGSKAQLKQALTEEWAKIGPELTTNLVTSMPNRLKEVIKRKGFPTHY